MHHLSQRVWLDLDVINRIGEVIEAQRVRQVPADAGGHEFESVVGAVGPPRRKPTNGSAHIVPSAPHRYLRPKHSHRVLGRRHSQPQLRVAQLRVAIDQRLLCLQLAGEGRGEEVVSLS